MIVINGQETPDAVGVTLTDYLERGGFRLDRVAVELNGDIVPKASYADRVLQDGDRLEIVHFMGGG